MTRGAKPKPTALKLIQGNPGKRALPKNEPKPKPIKSPRPPVSLGDAAKKEWNRVTKELASLGLVSNLDTSALAAYCIAFERFKEANEALREVAKKDPLFKGMMIKTTGGNWIQNPLVGVARRAADDMLKFAAEFGMTPSARSRVAAIELDNKRDGWDEF